MIQIQSVNNHLKQTNPRDKMAVINGFAWGYLFHPTKKGVPSHSVFSLVFRGPFANPRTTKVQGDLFAVPQHDRSWTNSEAFDSLGPMESLFSARFENSKRWYVCWESTLNYGSCCPGVMKGIYNYIIPN